LLEDPPDAWAGVADLIPFPGRDGRGIKPELAGQVPFGKTLILAGALQALTKALELGRPEANSGVTRPFSHVPRVAGRQPKLRAIAFWMPRSLDREQTNLI